MFFSAHVVGLVALMTIGMTVDAEALPHEHVNPTSITDDGVPGEDIQAYVTPAQTQPSPVVSRDGYSTATLVDLAGTVGITNYSSAVFTNNPDCAVQWPYAVGVPMTYGFGMRDGRLHEGTDFVPGAGAHIQAIADGIVSVATDNGGAYGVTIVIDHVVDGRTVSSRYAHMEYDSRQVEVGDTVSVGQYIGRTGDTGRSFGAHLHFEVLQDGTTATDPLPWLRTYATC
ncbi:MAG: M23 family metallopeptidase [Microbacterium sp.]|uniref:M23 family metallopeptidase n=1 Tax=Microbacterium sp. TaxID=51671 RepID=UPI00261FD0A0|nr:M23 family metallopeptidase [Microbacterium sp.]MCX6501454.1 M23 family metallopeptidase [Microbacterium sp.]